MPPRPGGPTLSSMRDRHVPLLCGSCRQPLGCQEDICGHCGAPVRRARPSRREVSARHPRARNGPYRVRRAARPHGPVTRRVVADPSWAEDFARRRRERAEAQAHAGQEARELAAAIEADDVRYQRLSRRLEAFGSRLEVVRAEQAGSPAHRALVSHR